MSARLEPIEAPEEATTPGPWITERHDLTLYLADETGELDPIRLGYAGDRLEDTTFIAHAREDVPYLLAVVRGQQARLDAAEADREREVTALIDERDVFHHMAARLAAAIAPDDIFSVSTPA
jgi:hypothetical protein